MCFHIWNDEDWVAANTLQPSQCVLKVCNGLVSVNEWGEFGMDLWRVRTLTSFVAMTFAVRFFAPSRRATYTHKAPHSLNALTLPDVGIPPLRSTGQRGEIQESSLQSSHRCRLTG